MLTAGTDVFASQLSEEELLAVVAAGRQSGLRVQAHAHSLAGIWHAIRASVEGIEHCSCLTETGPEASEELLEAVADARELDDDLVTALASDDRLGHAGLVHALPHDLDGAVKVLLRDLAPARRLRPPWRSSGASVRP